MAKSLTDAVRVLQAACHPAGRLVRAGHHHSHQCTTSIQGGSHWHRVAAAARVAVAKRSLTRLSVCDSACLSVFASVRLPGGGLCVRSTYHGDRTGPRETGLPCGRMDRRLGFLHGPAPDDPSPEAGKAASPTRSPVACQRITRSPYEQSPSGRRESLDEKTHFLIPPISNT